MHEQESKGFQQVQENPCEAALEMEEEKDAQKKEKEALPKAESKDIIAAYKSSEIFYFFKNLQYLIGGQRHNSGMQIIASFLFLKIHGI